MGSLCSLRCLTWLPLLSLLMRAMGDDTAWSVGIPSIGCDMVLINAPRECGDLRLWYNISYMDISYGTESAVIEFLTPDDGAVWMVLRPAWALNVIRWQVTLREGKQFVLRNSLGVQQLFTVQAHNGTAHCDQDAQDVRQTDDAGELMLSAYNRLRSTNVTAMEVTSTFPTDSRHFEPIPSVSVRLGQAVIIEPPSGPDPNGSYHINVGATVGSFVGALVVGLLVGVWCVLHPRRERARQKHAEALEDAKTEVATRPTPYVFTGPTEVTFDAEREEKAVRFEQAIESSPKCEMKAAGHDALAGPCQQPDPEPEPRVVASVMGEHSRSYFGGQSDYPTTLTDSSRSDIGSTSVLVSDMGIAPVHVPPPRYSQYA